MKHFGPCPAHGRCNWHYYFEVRDAGKTRGQRRERRRQRREWRRQRATAREAGLARPDSPCAVPRWPGVPGPWGLVPGPWDCLDPPPTGSPAPAAGIPGPHRHAGPHPAVPSSVGETQKGWRPGPLGTRRVVGWGRESWAMREEGAEDRSTLQLKNYQ